MTSGAAEATEIRAELFADVQRVPVRALSTGHSPRQEGEDIEHTRMLARIDDGLPPILVHRPTMRVIDGAHRLGAARLRGEETIEVRFFDGSEMEAFLLAVRANTTHGLPLTHADRSRAAERIIVSHPTWSDRAIAQAAGLGARTVATLRRKLELGGAGGEATPQPQARTGRDGRIRPLDNAIGRLRAAAVIKERPDASLREVAREVGVSPSTVRDVRARLQRGDDPVPGNRVAGAPRPVPATTVEGLPEVAMADMLEGLRNDPSLRFSESGRNLLRWIQSRAVRPEERVGVADQVPTNYAGTVAELARGCADEWLQLADALEEKRSHSR
ncbi:ParB/RepB/Spo0J family partition protein [Micromonospora robiginosa]|uniref:ParB/RepB/Spo0J family partition protein n=1 Tax=Micromonospora robiginosa TaxID=2749844 RepID=A0A7L6BFB4_9ACTN|nr:ParB/RepB/Spo0J family partition protein [Micromonospora ferruginea]QLQ40521.2 ParB/RepB/Spo0J family partition protein [Micromonospora ferruginea]